MVLTLINIKFRANRLVQVILLFHPKQYFKSIIRSLHFLGFIIYELDFLSLSFSPPGLRLWSLFITLC